MIGNDEAFHVESAAEVRLTGAWRHPVQLLHEQQLSSGPTVHDAAVAASLNLSGAPIEGPTHFMQFVPLAMSLWGSEWLTNGCISAHFTAPVSEGQTTQATVVGAHGAQRAHIVMQSDNARQVLVGDISVAGARDTVCGDRLARAQRPDNLRILDQVEVGDASAPLLARLTFDEPSGPLYPFTLARKLDVITEPHAWYWSGDNPWGAPLIPLEMLAVLLHEHSQVQALPVSRRAVGLFLDQEIRVHDGPLLVGEDYAVQREVVAVGGGRSTESMWLRSTATDLAGRLRVTMLLHIGFLRATAGV